MFADLTRLSAGDGLADIGPYRFPSRFIDREISYFRNPDPWTNDRIPYKGR